MNKQRYDMGAGLEKWLICLTALIGMFFFIGLSDADQKGIGKGSHSDLIEESRAQNFDDQIAFVQSEIKKIYEDRSWLSLKVKRMEDFGRGVPQLLYDSIVFKESKIKSLEKLKSRYQTLAKHTHTSSMGKVKKGDLNSGFEKRIEEKILASDLEDWVELMPNEISICLKNRLPILFTSGSAALAKGYEPFLKKLAVLVKGYDARIIINGYADTDPIHTRKYPSNFELGAARAASVVHFLVKSGIKPSVFKIGSTGEYRFASRKTSEWKNLQRHVDINVFLVNKGDY